MEVAVNILNYIWRLVPANPILLRVVDSGGKRKRDLFIFQCTQVIQLRRKIGGDIC